MNIRAKLPFTKTGEEIAVKGLARMLGGHDALALMPYDDGTFYLKPANFDKELIGGQGGYETADGDKIVMDGDGEPLRNLFGIPMLLAVDPTEHAAAVDPIKALVAQKNNIGEWLRVDKKGHILEVGDAIEPAGEIDATLQGSAVEDALADGGMALEQATENQIRQVIGQLAEQGDVSKIYDIAPPAGVHQNEDGELELEEATHIAVDQSKAADLLPTTTSTTELNVALDKARMEEHEEGQRMRDMILGIVIGGVTVGLTGGLFFLINAIL